VIVKFKSPSSDRQISNLIIIHTLCISSGLQDNICIATSPRARLDNILQLYLSFVANKRIKQEKRIECKLTKSIDKLIKTNISSLQERTVCVILM
jgi:hypothetical protein